MPVRRWRAEDDHPDSDAEEPRDPRDKGRARPEGASRWSHSSVTQNEAGSGAIDGRGTANTEHALSHPGCICRAECSNAKEVPNTKVPHTEPGIGPASIGRGTLRCGADRPEDSVALSINRTVVDATLAKS